MRHTRINRPFVLTLIILVSALTFFAAPLGEAYNPARQDSTTAWAEAVGQANLRSGPGVDYPTTGEISAGTQYPVLAQHALVPWLQLDVPGVSAAWVYQDLVTITGSLAQVPAVNDFPSAETATPVPASATPVSATPVSTTPAPVDTMPLDIVTATATATATPAQPSATPTYAGPVAITLGEVNVRFGPDVEYPVIVQVPEGTTFRILERHTLVPWIRVALDESPTSNGWVYNDLVTISGDLYSVPSTSANVFSYPTLTPTPQTVIVDQAPWLNAPTANGQLATTLGEQLHAYLLEQGFAPYSDRTASVFVMDLTTGDHFTINDNVAFSGMSLTKIPILAAYFQHNPTTPNNSEAWLIADTMMCSENITTNQLLAAVGDGDALTGAQRVTAFLQNLGLTNTFIMRQYVTVPDEEPPSAGTLTTEADQVTTQPDAYNQVTVSDLGWLLASIYTCAENETGLLIEHYPDDFNAQVCRKMLYAMDANQIGVFLEAGVPAGTRVIHKHGWISDTHGDAGIVIGPNGAYVFVATLYAEEWLEFDQSAPVIGELSRLTWNVFNPDNPLSEVQAGTVPADCDPTTDPVMSALLSGNLPMIGP